MLIKILHLKLSLMFCMFDVLLLLCIVIHFEHMCTYIYGTLPT